MGNQIGACPDLSSTKQPGVFLLAHYIGLPVTIFLGFKQNTNITPNDCGVSNLFCCHFEQHIVFGMTAILAWIIPDIPKEVENQVKRENFLAREALRSADQYETGSPEPPEDHRGENDML